MKRFFLTVSFFLLLSSLFSCASSSIRVPGESRIILKNLATEYYTIAEGYMDLKKYDKAAEYYTLAMRNKDLYLTAYYKLARCYALSENWKKAGESYSELLKLDPNNTMLKTSMAYIMARRGDIDEALVLYHELSESNPYDENILESYLALLIHLARKEDAEQTFLVFKEKFPDNKQITSFEQELSALSDSKPEKK